MMTLLQIDTNNRHHTSQFFNLPFRIYRNTPQWVPMLEMDAKRMLNRKQHPFYQHSDTAFFSRSMIMDKPSVASQYSTIGITTNTIKNRPHSFICLNAKIISPRRKHYSTRRFIRAHKRGLNKIIGPKGFSALDGTGLLVRGFEYRPALSIPYNPPYYPEFIEAARFVGTGDIVSGYLDANAPFPDRIHQVAELVQKKRGLRIVRFNTRRDLEMLVTQLKELYNSSIEGTIGNYLLTDDEVKTLADQILWLADPRLIKLVMKDDELVG